MVWVMKVGEEAEEASRKDRKGIHPVSTLRIAPKTAKPNNQDIGRVHFFRHRPHTDLRSLEMARTCCD